MLQTFVNSLVTCGYGYAAVGVLFSVPFVTYGIRRVDHEAQGSGWGFRIIVTPGVIALWPLLAYRWIAGSAEPPMQKDPHR